MAIGVERKPRQLALIGAAILVALSGICYLVLWKQCLAQTEGHFTYALDDPYIHLAIARNFAEHGVWGVTEYAESASSSSPLWVALLCLAIRVAGDWVYWPFVLGILFSIAATLVAYFRFVRAGIGVPLSIAAAAVVFAATPLHLLPFTGMEHSLQVFLDLVFAFWLLDKFDRPAVSRDVWIGFGLSFLICLCRYESAFLVVVPFFAIVWRKEWKVAAAMAVGPVAAVGGFALFSHSLGMPWIPNSIVLKGTAPQPLQGWWLEAMYLHLRGRALSLSDMFAMCVLAGLALRMKGLREGSGPLQIIIWTVVSCCLMQSGLAAVGIYYRYEAYLMALAPVVLILFVKAFADYRGRAEERQISKPVWLAVVGGAVLLQFLITPVFWIYQIGFTQILAAYGIGIIGLVAMETGSKTQGRLVRSLVFPFVLFGIFGAVQLRALLAYGDLPKGCADVYLQQYQMARFANRYYNRSRLVANDIGCISYFTRVHLLDLWGLASDEVRKWKLIHGAWNTERIEQTIDAFHPDAAVLYPQWYLREKSLPKSLIPVATWTIPPVTSVGRRIVMFYAPNVPAAELLRKQLLEFEPSLPKAVTVLYGAEAISHVPRF